ncbi:hypothetical protein KEJ17_00355 [Candidatus Bathyarchaeota archaeon]|nr:hypothetical protein [Candidatus Bathyarchaeota archaeon]
MDKEAIKVVDFIEDLVIYMAASDVVVTQGYTTLWELAAIAVTFPHHLEQVRFVRAMEARGTAMWIPRIDLSAEILAEKIIKILSDEALATRMSESGRKICRESGARKTAKVILQILKKAI